MSDEVHWLPNWRGMMLHAVVGPEPQEGVFSACGILAYPMEPKDRKRIAKGIVLPRCKRCEAFFLENKKLSGGFLDAESREKLAIEITRKLFTDGMGKFESEVIYLVEQVIASFRINTGGTK